SVGNIYVADTFSQTIRVITQAGVVTTLAGLANTPGTTDGQGNAARFSLPSGIAVDSTGVYVADTSNHTIRKVASDGTVTTFAGTAGSLGTTDNAFGTAARFNHPTGLAIDSNHTLYVADAFNHAIRKITSNGFVSTLAGGLGVAGSTDANGTSARF